MKESKLSYWASYLTTVVSVALVLVILGCIAMISVCASQESRHLRENVEMTATMNDSISNEQAEAIYQQLKTKPWVKEIEFFTREQVLEIMNNETGDDIEKIAGVNFLSPEITFSLKAEYCDDAHIRQIATTLDAMPQVEDVAIPDAELIDTMNTNIETLTLVLGIVAAVMILISIVLINNTVRLTIYSRRFTIHTMQLVGATRSFIRWPFVKDNILAGLIAGLAATGILAGGVGALDSLNISGLSISWGVWGIISGGLVMLGMVLCAISSSIATTKYLRKSYDQLFK